MKQLRGIGGFLALAGVGSVVLYFLGHNLRILTWIDRWGADVGWGIRIGLIVVGGTLTLADIKGSSAPEPKKQQ